MAKQATSFEVIFVKSAVFMVALLTILFFYISNPADDGTGFPCLMRSTTGWQCWGCGGQRAFHELLHGNFPRAFSLNALVFPVVALLGYVLVAELFQQHPTYSFIRRRLVQIVVLTIVTIFTISRNLF